MKRPRRAREKTSQLPWLHMRNMKTGCMANPRKIFLLSKFVKRNKRHAREN